MQDGLDFVRMWPFSSLYDKYFNRSFVKWFEWIAKDIKDRKISGTIVDIGTGPGRLPVEIAKQVPNARVIGIDISKEMFKLAKKNAKQEGRTDIVEFRVASAYDTEFQDSSVDLVVSTGLIHHLAEPTRAFDEIHRILKSGGEGWMYDGRSDATKAEIEETIRSLGIDDLPVPLWIIQMLWPHMHVGFETEAYISGPVWKNLRESLFRNYRVKKEGAYVEIVLEKT